MALLGAAGAYREGITLVGSAAVAEGTGSATGKPGSRDDLMA